MRYIYVLLISLFPFASNAQVTYSTNIHPDVYHPSANAACASLQSESDYALVGPNGKVEGFYGDGSGVCYYVYSDPSQFGGTRTNGFVVGGVSPRVLTKDCNAGDPTTVNWPFGTKDPLTDEVPPSGAHLPPWPVCSEGCMSEYVSVASCFNFPDENPLKVYCDYNATLNGQACSTTDEPTKPELPDTPPPDPCVANPTAEGCDDGDDPGDGGGDPGDGGGDPGDGGGDPGDGGGDPGDGGGDPGDGGGDPGDGGGHPGDGGGDPGDGGGDPGDGGADGGDGSAVGIACDQPLTCAGDPVGCAQLQVQKDLLCNGPDLDFPGQSGDIADFLDDPKYQEEEGEEVDVSDFVKEGSRFLPSSCPAPLTHTLSSGHTIRIAYDPICQIADSLSYLFVALAWVFFAVYVGRSSGGE